MRVLAIDLGKKNIGLAITDSLQIIASPLKNYFFPKYSVEQYIKTIKNIFIDYKNDISTIVLGYPKKINGDKTEWTLMVEDFSRELADEFPNVKVILYDERFSTVKTIEHLKVNAELKMSKIKKIKDMMSAQLILQNYLDNKKIN